MNSEEKTKQQILEKTAREYFDSGQEEFIKKRYNSSVVLFFKSLISLIDLYIFQQTDDTPSSHGQRFRITMKNFPEVYDLLDKDFPFYQDSYVQIAKNSIGNFSTPNESCRPSGIFLKCAVSKTTYDKRISRGN